MKRFAALLTAFVLLMTASALAFGGVGYPAWDGLSTPDNSFCGAIGSDRITLSFDPSGDYSYTMDGVIQACFFAYDATESNYLEMYLMLPQDVMPGDVLRSDSGQDCALYLCEITTDSGNDIEYFAGELDGEPDGSSFELTIESVQMSGTMISMTGRVTAQMCRYDRNMPQRDGLTISDAYFNFSLPLTSNPFENPFAPSDTQEPDDLPGLQGAPSFTLPPNYAVI